MANVAAGTVWNLPNYTGELFTSDVVNTPFLSMIGGLTGGMQTDNFEFATDSQYSHEAAAQPAITETASLTAPTAISYVRNQSKNVVQIFQEAISISYVRLSNQGRLTGINTASAENNVTSERDWQIAKALEKIARDVEYSFINGVYQIAVNAGVANKTRGMIALSTVNTVDASAGALSKALMDTLLLEMFANGAYFKNPVIFCGGFQKQKISDIYGYAPTDRNVGGVNVKQIETDFGNIAIADPHRFMPAGTLLVADMSVIAPVFQPVPEKGNLFYEPLSKTGASESGHIFGQVGLAHGPAFMHGTITNLATS
ncbi:MAG TPA: hypothetical protein DDY71_09930 [Spirochaetia bacterium]|nr:hypothetical protein [Spirochaetia bacterium]